MTSITDNFMKKFGGNGASEPAPAVVGNPGTTASFLAKYGGDKEFKEYKLYNGSVTLRFDAEEHKYYYVSGDELVHVPNCTTILGIWDKSPALMPWAARQACDKMREKIHNHIESGHSVQELDLETLEVWLDEAAKNYKATSQKALDVGSMAHDLLEKFIKGAIAGKEEPIQFPNNEAATSCCFAGMSWMHKHKVRWVSTERKIFSKAFWYTGTTDGECYFTSCDDPKCECVNHPKYVDALTIVDWKSSKAIYDEYFQQGASYKVAREEEYPDQPIELLMIVRLGKEDGKFEFKIADNEDCRFWFQGFLAALKGYNWKAGISDYKKFRKSKRKTAKDENKPVKAKKAKVQ